MDAPPATSKSALFQVFLRLRPPPVGNPLYPTLPTDRFLAVEEREDDGAGAGADGNGNGNALPTHITLNPPNDNRRRAVEKFAFTRVFEEESSQLDVFHGSGVVPLVEGVLGADGGEGRDGLLATLGVTGSGKSHTILGSKNQRGLTQLALDLLFRSIEENIVDVPTNSPLHASIAAADPSEAQVLSAQMFLDASSFEPALSRGSSSRAPTPLVVRMPPNSTPFHQKLYPALPPFQVQGSPQSIRIVIHEDEDVASASASGSGSPTRSTQLVPPGEESTVSMTSFIPSFMQATATAARKYISAKTPQKGDYHQTPRRTMPRRPSALPSLPDISDLTVDADPNAEYAILISMYEVYNDRIFDLLTPAAMNKSTRDARRRPLLFKPTEQSPDRKVVAGLRKVICASMKDALMVLETGLQERRVAGTGTNSVSSRSHGFFCVEVKKRRKSRNPGPWGGSALTIVDLAGSERARDAKTHGTTLTEAGKINESLMYLGQCLQVQSDLGSNTKPNLVPFRQCKLTELLFSNSFPSANQQHPLPRNPQKAIMIVTADPWGDFNATSQILRYSALAREITVPRVPSITATILASSQQSHSSSHSHSNSQSHTNPYSPTSPYHPRYPRSPTSPTDTERETMEIAALEIARMSEEIDGLRAALSRETRCRMDWEQHALALEDKMLELEMETREECAEEMERRLEEQERRWRVVVEEAGEREGAWRDRKVEVVLRGLGGGDEGVDGFAGEGEDKENEGRDGEGLKEENRRLKREVEGLRREVWNEGSPVKKKSERVLKERGVLREREVSSQLASRGDDEAEDYFGNVNGYGNDGYDNDNEEFDLGESMKRLNVRDEQQQQQLMVDKVRGSVNESGSANRKGSANGSRVGSRNASANGSPVKRVRKLTARKWDLGDEGEL
ncbi:hypothetical protein CJF32_00009349 [Rutstroemia sp. NJR-2017a WRK4]|nr:hypothetical protein CJF32_00009349 [Rutstroemia sp. NJR-2017a WRK4]